MQSNKPLEVQALLGYSQEKTAKLLHLKRGSDQAMRTLGLYLAVSNQIIYRLSEEGLSPASVLFQQEIIELEQTASQAAKVIQPPFIEIEARWEASARFSGALNNILGNNNGRLVLAAGQITVPTVTATRENLIYYGATLIQPGDLVRFPDPIYPIWSMSIDEHYVQDFLLSPQGGGFYLEYHRDQPHYHHAICGSGYYLLARWNASETALQITGFQIPQGHAVYTRKGAIHCDAGLIGRYLVGYTTSEDYSTVLLRSQAEEEIVKIKFESLS